jgi:hypothetical protein
MEMNKNIDNLLNECLERVIFRGESMEEVLKSYPAEAAELKPLLKTALMVKQAAAISPSPEYRARARYEFHQALALEKTAKHGFSLRFMPRWATALSVALAVLLASGGAVAASTTSMPDSPLYPVKLATEQARMTITFSDEAKAELYAEQTDTRVGEIVYMANKGDIAQIAVLSQRLDDRMDNLAVVARAAYGKNGQSNFAVNAPANAEAATRLPPSGGGPIMSGGASVASPKPGEATGAAPAPANPPGTLAKPSSPQPQLGVAATGKQEKEDSDDDSAVTAKSAKEQKLKIMLSAYAVKHPAQLRAALEKVPEPARQDILRSIAITAAGYEKALRSIEQP